MNKLIAASVVSLLVTLTTNCQAQQQRSTQPPLFTLAPGFPLNIGSNPNDIALADWNKDGKLDIATCNEGDTVKVFLGNGRGSFAAAPGPPISVAAHLIAAGDVNNDGNSDLALTHHDSFGVVILLGAGDGRFAPAPSSPFVAHQGAKAHNHGLTLTDVNGDKNLDITTSNQDDNSVSVLLGNGKGGFSPSPGSPFAVGNSPYPHVVGDVNKDGKPDIVTPNVRSNNVSVLLGDGRGGFTAATNSPYAVATRPYYIALADVNGDAKPDLVTTHDDINLMSTLLGDGSGGFTASPASPYDLGTRAYKLIAADVNKDARMDLIIGTEGSASVMVMLGNERGGYAPAAGSPYTAGSNPKAAFGDVNGDGKPDIVTANNGSASISVLLGK